MRYIFIILAIFCMSSCVVLPTTYYEPLGKGDRSTYGCGGGPSDEYTFEISNGIKSVIRISYFEKTEASELHVGFLIPSGEAIKLMDDTFTIQNEENTTITEIKVRKIQKTIIDPRSQYGARTELLNPSEVMPGDTFEAKNIFGSYERDQWYYILFENHKVLELTDNIKIQYPPIIVNKEKTNSLFVKFKKATSLNMYAINC